MWQSKDHYRVLVESCPASILLLDASAHIIDCNEEMYRPLGYDIKEIKGRDVRVLLASATQGGLASHLDDLNQKGYVESEFELIRRDG